MIVNNVRYFRPRAVRHAPSGLHIRRRGRGRIILISIAIWTIVAGLAILLSTYREEVVAAVRAAPGMFSGMSADPPLRIEPAVIPASLSRCVVNAMRERWTNIPDDTTIVFYDRRDIPGQGNMSTVFAVGAVSATGEGWVFAYDVASDAIVEAERHLTVRSEMAMRVFKFVASERGHVPTRIRRDKEGYDHVEFYDGWDGGCGHYSYGDYTIAPDTLEIVGESHVM